MRDKKRDEAFVAFCDQHVRIPAECEAFIAGWDAKASAEPPAAQPAVGHNFERSIYEASIVGLRNLLSLALAHVDFGALKVSHVKDHDTLAPFATSEAARNFTPDEAKAYRAFIEDFFEPAAQPMTLERAEAFPGGTIGRNRNFELVWTPDRLNVGYTAEQLKAIALLLRAQS